MGVVYTSLSPYRPSWGGGGEGEVATPEPPRSAPDDIILPASMSHKTIQKGIKEIRNLVRNLEIIKTGKITR